MTYSTSGSAGDRTIKIGSKETEISGRGFIRILQVARTLADLESPIEIDVPHVAEAVNFRSLEQLMKYCDPSKSLRSTNSTMKTP